MTSPNNPKASSVVSQGVKFRALSPQISFGETRFSFAIPGRPANAYSLDQTVASIAAMMDGRGAIPGCCHLVASGQSNWPTACGYGQNFLKVSRRYHRKRSGLTVNSVQQE